MVFYLSNSKGQKNKLEMLPMLRMGVKGPLYQDNSNNMQQLQGTITLETNFIPIYVQTIFYCLLTCYVFNSIQLHEKRKI